MKIYLSIILFTAAAGCGKDDNSESKGVDFKAGMQTHKEWRSMALTFRVDPSHSASMVQLANEPMVKTWRLTMGEEGPQLKETSRTSLASAGRCLSKEPCDGVPSVRINYNAELKDLDQLTSADFMGGRANIYGIHPDLISKIKVRGEFEELKRSCRQDERDFLICKEDGGDLDHPVLQVSPLDDGYLLKDPENNRYIILKPYSGREDPLILYKSDLEERAFPSSGVTDYLSEMTDIYFPRKQAVKVLDLETKGVPVYVNRNFPKVYYEDLVLAIEQWNETLGVDYFADKISVKDNLNDIEGILECTQLNAVCVSWYGEEVVSYAGVGGVAFSTADPLSGRIFGGMFIHVFNNSKPDLKKKLSIAELKNNAEKYTLDPMPLLEIPHELPNELVASVLRHEFGHLVGLRHNFLASQHRTDQDHVSVMDYPSFDNFHDNHIGSWDRALVNAIYQGDALPSDFDSCSDFDVQPVLDFSGQFKDFARPGCLRFDKGDPLEWLKRLASKTPVGLFKDIKPLPDAFIESYRGGFSKKAIKSDFTILGKMAPYLELESTSEELVVYLCQKENREAIGDHLQSYYEYQLSCP